jgi:hypothetical protein
MSFFPNMHVRRFSSRPSLVPSVTVVLLNLVTGGKGGEGLLAKPGAGLIQPLYRRDGHGRPGCQGEAQMAGRAAKGRSPEGAQAPSHAGICQTGAVGEGGGLPERNQLYTSMYSLVGEQGDGK